MAAAVLVARTDLDAAGLGEAARRAGTVSAAQRMLAPAMVVEGVARGAAATAAGMDRQALRDRVHRYNTYGLAGLYDRHGGGPQRRLSPAQESAIRRLEKPLALTAAC